MDINDLLENHLTIVGSTDSGKSTFGEMLFKLNDKKSVYYDQQDERTEGTLLATDEGKRLDWNIKYLSKYDKLLVYAPFSYEEKMKEIREIIKSLFRVGKILKPRKIWCILFVDEAHEIAPKHDRNNILNLVATKGKRYGITLVTMTQRPSMLSHTILTQSKNHIIFRLSKYEYPYFHNYKIPIEQFKSWIMKDYHFVLYDYKEEIHKYNPIKLDWKTEK